MSDDAIRNAERAYRASGAPQDGEAYVQAVLRSTGLNSTFLIARVIETQRALNTLLHHFHDSPTISRRELGNALERQVTPDDMVSFLRGGREWLAPPSIMHGQQGTDFLAVERPAIHPAQVDAPDEHPCATCGDAKFNGDQSVYCSNECAGIRGANDRHLNRRGVPRGDAILCNHANENPGHCPCEPDCYCRQDGHTCSDVRSEPNPFDRPCDDCSTEATWRFRYTTVVPNGHRNGRRVEVVCGSHLAQAREERATFNYDFMNRRAMDQRVEMLRDSHRHMDSLDEMVRHHEAVDDV